MLARAADNIFWMARYVERAEQMARLMEVSMRSAMLPAAGGNGGRLSDWETPLYMTGTVDDFLARYEKVTEGRVLSYMILDKHNPSSIRCALAQARENARAVRHLLTGELWEILNRTYLSVNDMTWNDVTRIGVPQHLEWVRFRSHLFRGCLFGSQRRGEGFHIAGFGMAVERADNTARLLRAKWDSLQGDATVRAPDFYRAGVLLESLSAYKAYREAYSAQLEPRRIAELLIQRVDVPRSLAFCVREMEIMLRGMDPDSPLLGDIAALSRRLEAVTVTDLVRVGLNRFLDDIIAEVGRLSDRTRTHYLMVV
ncbi:alpha-E domain-containing protein [Novispirillum sp. DQ9]|uniref:alpha-E domain-containing protein n=1 Tax=Novispirillum sp. DQ9 TaxID=3398612 RepID=UPI003C7C56E5